MKKDRILKIIDVTMLIVISAICGIYATTNIISETDCVDYETISTVLLFAIALHLILSIFTEFELFKKQDILISKVDTLDAIKGVKKFARSGESDQYIAEKIASAKDSVDDLNWQDDLPFNPKSRNPQKKRFTEKAIDRSIKSFCKKQDRIYREIFTFTYKANIDKMKTHITYGDSYSCAYFENKSVPKFPKMQFVIIDGKEVIFASSAYEPHIYAIEDENFVHMFSRYFEQAWRESTAKIKDSKTIHDSIVDEIENKYKYS